MPKTWSTDGKICAYASQCSWQYLDISAGSSPYTKLMLKGVPRWFWWEWRSKNAWWNGQWMIKARGSLFQSNTFSLSQTYGQYQRTDTHHSISLWAINQSINQITICINMNKHAQPVHCPLCRWGTEKVNYDTRSYLQWAVHTPATAIHYHQETTSLITFPSLGEDVLYSHRQADAELSRNEAHVLRLYTKALFDHRGKKLQIAWFDAKGMFLHIYCTRNHSTFYCTNAQQGIFPCDRV